MKTRVLFVDDEPNVLEGLRRMTRSMRSEWEVRFAPGGREALALLESHPCDVVISDMRMPGMDGTELLSAIQKAFPEMVRIILSGHSDHEMIMKSVKPAHQFLSKPCSPEKLKQTVTNAMLLRNLLTNDAVKKTVSQIDTLPTCPEIYVKLMEVLDNEKCSLEQVGEIISRDVSMTASILKLVNSSFFGFVRRINTPGEAVNLLGIEIVKSLILTRELFCTFRQHSFPGFSLACLWEHSLVTARFAKVIALKETKDKSVVDDSFIAGMLHDVGKLIIAVKFEDKFRDILQKAKAENRAARDVEIEVLGVGHDVIGAYLLGLWGLPSTTVETIAFHHEPSRRQGEKFCPLTAVHAANAIDHEIVVINDNYAKHPMDMEYMERLGLAQRAPVWKDACAATLENEKEVRDAQGNSPPCR